MRIVLPHPKLLLAALGLCLALLATTLWSLSPHSDESKVLSVSDLISEHSWSILEQPTGNIFNQNRELGAVTPEVDDEAKQETEPKEVSYRLLGIIRKGNEQQALFVGNGERIILHIGDELPNIGHLRAIKNNTVIIQDEVGTEKEWLLFPTGNTQNVKDKEKS
ncbi:hypothetical protein VrSk94_34490 [Vibrio rotiferianus]|uniref:hypothetical protein n=1 Tax=Vibrio rotiferianus TaxID=190895 RepID=UPI0002376716|nr:hypothetical protein [Vibrio rotiferianus]